MTRLVFDFPCETPLGQNVRDKVDGEKGRFIMRTFPDGETYVRLESLVSGRDVIINASFVHANDWFLNLLFLADALHSQGARRVGLLAPYLSYMRQDTVFHPGEAVTSRTFARLISTYFDYLITIDPHLHRYHNLSEIYSIPSTVLHAAPLISEWIHRHVEAPFLIGPDGESEQWVKAIAGEIPFTVLNKIRHEDGHVEISWPPLEDLSGKTPVLVDDIISSGATMLQAVKHLKNLTAVAPICMAVHPIFAEDSYQKLQEAGVKKIITCNSIPHPSNEIDVSPLCVDALKF